MAARRIGGDRMKWLLITLAVMLLVVFPNLLGLLELAVSEPVVMAFGVGTATGASWYRRRRTVHYRRRRR